MRKLLAAAVLFTSLSGTAYAAHGDLDAYVGEFSPFRSTQYQTVEGGVEYRWADQFNGLRPTVGAWVNGDGASYFYAGAYWDLPLGTAPFMITPGIQAGSYQHGSSKDLGGSFEFRDTIEITYRFDDGQRFGAQLTHMSNAGLDGNSNPGVEMVQAIYSIPVSW